MSKGEIRLDVADHVLTIEIDRAAKRNALTPELIVELCEAYGRLEEDPELRCALVVGAGDHFSGGLDLGAMAPVFAAGENIIRDDAINPWGTTGRRRSKPVVVAVQGICLTWGIELILASDVAVAASNTSFAQIEVQRGILPFGGATWRFAQRCGRGDAMRWILTGDAFDAQEAHRIGLVQEVVDVGRERDAGRAIAVAIAAQAPLAVQATLANGFVAEDQGERAAADELLGRLLELTRTEDAAEGMTSFFERRAAAFKGR